MQEFVPPIIAEFVEVMMQLSQDEIIELLKLELHTQDTKLLITDE